MLFATFSLPFLPPALQNLLLLPQLLETPAPPFLCTRTLAARRAAESISISLHLGFTLYVQRCSYLWSLISPATVLPSPRRTGTAVCQAVLWQQPTFSEGLLFLGCIQGGLCCEAVPDEVKGVVEPHVV